MVQNIVSTAAKTAPQAYEPPAFGCSDDTSSVQRWGSKSLETYGGVFFHAKCGGGRNMIPANCIGFF